MKKILVSMLTLAAVLVVLPMFAAFEAHVINVTATIENALSVPVTAIEFGTVFPQEQLEQELGIALSQSFLSEDRVDDVEYIIRQKPKCAWSWQENNVWHIDEGSTQTGHVIVGDNPNTDPVETYWINCGEAPKVDVPNDATWGVLPSLCEYISKHPDGIDESGTVGGNDGSLNSFHKPFTIDGNGNIVWNDVEGRLAKSDNDKADTWTIDLKVPCFGGYCAQDWEKFVTDINPTAIPSEYTQPIGNEHKVFGCNLWVEVEGVSEDVDEPTDSTDNG